MRTQPEGPINRQPSTILTLLALAALLGVGGCARDPATPTTPVAPARTLVADMTVAGLINPNYHYFLAIDTDGDPASGPVPDVAGLSTGWGVLDRNGATVGQVPFYVEYYNGRFQQFVNGAPAGQPFGFSASGGTLHVEIDQALLGTPIPANAEINWITQENLLPPGQGGVVAKQYDGLGPTGNTYLAGVPLGAAQVWVGNQAGAPEELAYRQTYANGLIENTTSNPDLDIIGWRLEVKIQ